MGYSCCKGAMKVMNSMPPREEVKLTSTPKVGFLYKKQPEHSLHPAGAHVIDCNEREMKPGCFQSNP